MRFYTILVLALLLCAGVTANPTPNLQAKTEDAVKKDEIPTHQFLVECDDGSKVVLGFYENMILELPYGSLKIPYDNIIKIEYAFRVSEETKLRIKKSIDDLGSNVYRTREIATDYLKKLGRDAFPFLKPHSDDKDLERRRRVEVIMLHIMSRVDAKKLVFPKHDVVYLKDSKITGDIKTPVIAVYNKIFGKLNLDLHRCENALRQMDTEENFTISYKDGWLKTNIVVYKELTLNAKTDGRVDVHPVNPGTYMADANGYSNNTSNGHYSGALLGKIGEQGKIFLIGANYNQKIQNNGILYLKINDPPRWSGNKDILGSFNVNVKVK